MAGIQQNLSIFIGIAIAILMEKISFAKYNFSKPVFVLISKIKQQEVSLETRVINHYSP
jgi:hypothetical protein